MSMSSAPIDWLASKQQKIGEKFLQLDCQIETQRSASASGFNPSSNVEIKSAFNRSEKMDPPWTRSQTKKMIELFVHGQMKV